MKNKKIDSKIIGNLAPYIGVIAVLIIFTALTGGRLVSADNLQAMSNQIITTALATIGAVFVFGAGYFDMSVGASTALSAVLGGMATIATGNLLVGIIVIIAVSLAFGLVKGIFAATVNVPFFIFTIVLGSVITSVLLVVLNKSSTIYLKNAVSPIREFSFTEQTALNVICLIGYFVVCLVLFNYTSIGLRAKNMGGNIIATKQSGIDTKKTTIQVFIIAAIGVAIAATLLLIRTRAVGTGTAGSLGTDVMTAIVLGGMPLSGGPRSKISAGILGAATITILNSGLVILGLTTGQIQVVRGIVFIVVVFISSFSYRTKLLPR